jgi:hypothetical protein
MESNIPPMLAAQSASPSGPLPGFHKLFRSTNLRMIQIPRQRGEAVILQKAKLLHPALAGFAITIQMNAR